jgi:hypothetical protein
MNKKCKIIIQSNKLVASAEYIDNYWRLENVKILPPTVYLDRKWFLPVAQLGKSQILSFSFYLQEKIENNVRLRIKHASTEAGAFLTYINIFINKKAFLIEHEPLPHEFEGTDRINWETFDINDFVIKGDENILNIESCEKSQTVYFFKALNIFMT